MKKYYVAQLAEGSRIEDVFLVASKSVASTRAGAPFLKLRLADKTGFVDAVKWEIAESEISKLNEDDYIYVSGTVRSYNGDLQVTLDSLRKHGGSVDPSDFLATSARNPEDMMRDLKMVLSSITSPHLNRLLAIFLDEEPCASRFRECPAAKSIHHAYIGGLLEHTLSVTRCCAVLAQIYPRVDKDLLLTAAALHDVGKIDEYEWSGSIRYSDTGHMIGHLVGGAMMVKEAAQRIDGFDPILSLALQHAILAHHGTHEFGSPKRPKSLEAVLLHMADDLDAQVAIIEKAIDESDASGETGLFTSKKIYPLERPIFKGLPSPALQKSDESAGEYIDADLFAADLDSDPFAD